MIIKESHQVYPLKSQIIVLLKRIKLRYYTVLLLLFLLIASAGIGGIYYGTKLSGSEYSAVFASFYRFFRPSLNIVTHYFEGLISQPEELSIHIKHLDYQKLAYRVQNARIKGVIGRDEKKEEVNAIIEHNNQKYDIKIKLKGLYLDHLKGDKWSFRVKVKDNKAIFGMTRFSLHSPETRSHIHEWVFQKALQYEGLIYVRYKFIKVYLNGKKLGIYALEEFFEKRLIENNQRREGIIVKPDRIINSDGNQVDFNSDVVNNNTIFPFVYQQAKVLSDTILSNSYNYLSNSLHLFRTHKIPASSLIDFESTAKYFALSTIFGGQHSHMAANLPFYFNPVTTLLEPIGYDSNVARNIERYGGMITSPNNAYHSAIFIKSGVVTNLFNSDEFYTLYIQELKRMTEKNYIPSLFATIKKELDTNLGILYKEYPYFDFFKRDFISANINYVKKQLFDEEQVKATFLNHNNINLISVNVDNLKDVAIKILGLELGGDMVYRNNNETIVKSTTLDEPHMARFYGSLSNSSQSYSANELKLIYQIHGLDSIFKVEVDRVPLEFYKDHNLSDNIYYKRSTVDQYSFLDLDYSTNTIIVHTGKHQITSDLIIPKDHILTLNPGVELNLLNSGKIISYSPIQFQGTKEYPITIYSSDSTGQGITLISTKGESLLKYVFFDNLCNLSMYGWELTGAVNFYESDVIISNCLFSNNFSEDALNIIRSKFELKNTDFKNTQSDAFDGDHSDGIIVNSSFTHCGNDGIDISGSNVNISNVFINYVGDKGISVGEKSKLEGRNIEITNSEIGITSKDLSEIELEKVKMSNLKLGFTAFQKKSEYGPGNIKITGLITNNIEVPFMIEQSSTMIVDNIRIENINGKVEDILYGNVFGKNSE